MEHSTTAAIITLAGQRYRVLDEQVVAVAYIKDGIHLSYSYTAVRVKRVDATF